MAVTEQEIEIKQLGAEGVPSASAQVYAKLNLQLRVTGRRAVDGYHLLSMLNVELPDLADQLTLQFTEDGQRRVKISVGSHVTDRFSPDLLAELSDPHKNLAARAVEATLRLLLKNAGAADSDLDQYGYKLSINKNIPAGGGLGGGSADAAASIKLTEALASKHGRLSDIDRLSLAASLGADVPYFLTGKSCSVEGIGDIVRPVVLPSLDESVVLLVLPSFGINTAAVYQQLRSRSADELSHAALHPASNRATIGGLCIENDLELPATEIEPRLAVVLSSLRSIVAHLEGDAAAGMTGSGSTCFILCKKQYVESLHSELNKVVKSLGCVVLGPLTIR